MITSDDFASILQQMPDDRGLVYKGGGAWIRCPNPEHSGGSERTPSLKINIDTTDKYPYFFHCFGCGFSGHWNKMAKLLDLPELDTGFSKKGERGLGFRRKIAQLESDQSAAPVGEFVWPENKSWRGVPGKLIVRVGGRVMPGRHKLDDPTLVFPVTMWGEHKGSILAKMSDSKRDSSGSKIEKSYWNSPGDWVQEVLFQYDIARLDHFANKVLWVVEGPRDVFQLLRADCRAVGIMGTKFGESRADLIRLLDPPAILVATDNDDAGDKAAEKILEQLGDFIPCIRVRWKSGKDPADQKVSLLRRVNAMYQKRYGQAA